MGQLTSTEQHRDLDFVPLLEELVRPLGLRLEIVLADLRPEANLFQLNDFLMLASLTLLLRLLVLEATVVEQATDRRDDVGSDFDEIQVSGLGQLERLVGGHHPELLAVLVDDPDLTDANSLVNAELSANGPTPCG